MIERFLNRPAMTLGAIALITAAFVTQAVGVRVDNTAEAWLPTQDDSLEVYREFRAVFGEDTFLLLASDLLDYRDPATRAELVELETALAGMEGVHSVIGPLAEGDQLTQARRQLPRQLQLLGRARESGPQVAEDLLLLEGELCATYAFLFLDDEPEAAIEHYLRAQDASLEALGRIEPGLPAALTGLTSDAAPAELLIAAGPRAVPGAFWWAFAKGAQLRASGFEPALLADLPRIDAVMEWVLQRDEGFFHGGPHLYFAVRHAGLPRSMGGDPERSLPHFAALARLSGREALLPRVIYAELFAPGLAATEAGQGLEAVLAAQRRAWDEFSLTLREVAAAPPSFDVGEPIPNALARQRAYTMLSDPEAYGVIPPAGVTLEAIAVPAIDPALGETPLTPLLIGVDGDRLAWIVTPDQDLTALARNDLVERVEETLKQHEAGLGFFRMAGTDVVTHDLDAGSQASFGMLFPLVALAMALVLFGALGSFRVVLAILLSAALAAVWMVGALAVTGRTLNMIVVVVPAILGIVTTAYSMHLVARYLHLPIPAGPLDRPARIALWQSAAALTIRPCALTAITTAIGLSSLAVSEIPPVRDLGVFAAFGVLVSFLLSFTLLPTVLSLTSVVPQPQTSRWWTAARAKVAVRELSATAPWILAGGGGLALVAGLGISVLQVESHILRFFPAQHRLPTAYADIEQVFPGLTPLEVWLAGEAGAVLSADTVAALDAFLDKAVQEPLVTHTVSPLANPAGRSLSPQARADLLRVADDAQLARLVHRREGHLDLRVNLSCKTTSSDDFHHLVQRLEGAAAGAFPPGVSVRLTGAVPLLVRVQALLVETQLQSFLVAALLVTLVLAFSFRRLDLVFISLIPNLLPVALVLGLMGLVGIPLNTATVTVAGIALGLVVDDTIHFLHEYVSAPGPRSAAVVQTLLVVGRPIFTTSVAVAVGFGVFVLAPFRPTLYFGLLIALTAIGALVCDLVLLPALLLSRQDRAGDAAAPEVGSPRAPTGDAP